MRVLLDTNVVVWLLLGRREQIPDRVREVLAEPRNPVLVSAASVWEIAIKRSVGKLRIEPRWPAALKRLGFEHCPVTAEHAAAVESLPWLHRDPFDRLLVAQAMLEDVSLVTADSRIRSYDVPTLWP